MGKTSYCPDWEKEFEWLSACKDDKYSAMCKICNKTFSISGSGISQMKYHNISEKHQNVLADLQGSQRTFVRNNNRIQLSHTKFNLTDSEVLKAEVLQALHVTQYNISFASAVHHSS